MCARRYCEVLACVAVVCLLRLVAAGEPEPADRQVAVRIAVAKSLALIEKSTAEYREQRSCFSCHHQAMPTIALVEAQRRGFAVDGENIRRQLERTAQHLERGRESYREGKGQGGKADTAGYALWTLEAGGHAPDDTTEAVAEYLLLWQQKDDHWSCTSNRPPSEVSDFTTTYLALRGLGEFGAGDQQKRAEARRKRALAWLLEAKPKDTEDAVFRLRAMGYLGAERAAVDDALRRLNESQAESGGWPQTSDLPPDAYATAIVMLALVEYGGMSPADPVYRRGVQFLLDSQLRDGSWHVASRSKPFQTYFESAFPHEQDQFISMAATSWAVCALLETLPETSP